MRRGLFLVVLSSALLGAGGADSAPAVPTLAPAVTGNFTYSEAKALGIPTLPTPNELGLPLCRPNPDWQGFASPQEAELALRLAGADERGPECAVDPRQVIYSVRGPLAARPVPYQSGQQATYRHLGARTDAFGYYGSRITVEVSNPSVGHFASPSEFVSSRPLLSNGSNWIEGGWAEVSWMPDARYVYTYLGSGFDWYFHTQFPLSDGSYYIFRTHSIFGANTYAEIWWGGMWMVLHQSPTMPHCQGTGGCRVEQFTEAYSDRLIWPVFNAPVDGSGINHGSTMLENSSSQWVFWNDSLYPSLEPGLTPGTPSTSPYNACFANWDWNFRAVQGAC